MILWPRIPRLAALACVSVPLFRPRASPCTSPRTFSAAETWPEEVTQKIGVCWPCVHV